MKEKFSFSQFQKLGKVLMTPVMIMPIAGILVGIGSAFTTKNIVELMGGTIDVRSQVDQGTLFRVELELRVLEQAPGRAPEPEPEETNILQGMRFLAAEDNEINAEILSELLSLEGASCEIVANGQLAVERFQEAAPGEFDAI